MKFLLNAIAVVSMMPLLADAATYRTDLNRWLADELTPYVADQLSSMPRFKNEAVRFVVFDGDTVQSESNRLALSLRDRVRDAMSSQAGIRIVWNSDFVSPTDVDQIDCVKNKAGYYIGIEVIEDRSGLIAVNLRALDIVDSSWVAGFSRSWKGYPDAAQRRQLGQMASDPTFIGERGAPFDESQKDLVAAHLARELGCALLRQTAGEYVVGAPQSGLESDDRQAEMLALVSNNLSDYRALRMTSNGSRANATISGKAHRVDDDLYQYWMTITPTHAAPELPALSASAYVRVRDRYASASLIPSATVPIAKAEQSFLTDFRVVELSDRRRCIEVDRAARGSRVQDHRFANSALDCFALQVDTNADTILFFLNHQLNKGLVRLSVDHCDYRSDAKVARGGQTLRLPLPSESLLSAQWTAAYDWRSLPNEDTYYVLAARNTPSARALSALVRQLPNRCDASLRRGLDGNSLDDWMGELAALAQHFQTDVDWKVIRVKNLY